MNADTFAIHRRSHLFLLALIVVLAGALRFFSLSALGFWTDEFCTLSAADGWGLQLDKIPLNQIAPPLPVCTHLDQAHSFFQIPSAMARDDAHPPLYFLMLRGWEQMFGDGESAVRSLNVLFSVLAIVLLYFLARVSVGSTTALVACLLMAVATPQIQLSQEARNYMPVLVFALLAAIAIEKLRRNPATPSTMLLTVSLLAMMLTNYIAIGTAVGLAIYALLTLRNRARRLAIVGFVLAAIVFAVVWGMSLLKQRAVMHSGLTWLVDDAPEHLHRRLFDLCRLPVRFFAETTDPQLQILIAVIGAITLLTLPFLWLRRRDLRLWICWFISAVALIAIADVTRSTTQLNWLRYTLFATPPAYVLLAAAVPQGRWRFALPATAGIAALLSLPIAYVPPWKIDFRTPVQIVGHRLGPKDGLMIMGPDAVNDGIMFAAFQHYLPAMPTTAVFTAPPNTTKLDRISQCPQVWIVCIPPRKFDGLPGFNVNEEQQIPYFADLIYGHFATSKAAN